MSHARAYASDNRNSAELEIARRIAGENRHGDADHGLKWNLYAIAHPMVAGNPPEGNYRGGATARGGGKATAKTATTLRLRPQQMGDRLSTTGVLGTLRHDPELLGSPEAGWRRRMAAAEVEKGIASSGEIEANQGAGEHIRGSRSSLEKSERLERGRRSFGIVGDELQ